MVPDIQFLSDDESTGSSDSIAPNNQFQCNHCLRPFNCKRQLSKHKNQLSTRTRINVVKSAKRAMVRNQNEKNTRLPIFIPPPTSSQRAFYHNESPPPPPSHSLLFSMHGVGGNNRHFHPYRRPIIEVPTFRPPRHNNKIGESLGRTIDLISLIDKHVDSVSMEELPMAWGRGWFKIGSSNNNTNKNDINLDLKL